MTQLYTCKQEDFGDPASELRWKAWREWLYHETPRRFFPDTMTTVMKWPPRHESEVQIFVRAMNAALSEKWHKTNGEWGAADSYRLRPWMDPKGLRSIAESGGKDAVTHQLAPVMGGEG